MRLLDDLEVFEAFLNLKCYVVAAYDVDGYPVESFPVSYTWGRNEACREAAFLRRLASERGYSLVYDGV